MITRINRNKPLVKNGESFFFPLYPKPFPVNPVFPGIMSKRVIMSNLPNLPLKHIYAEFSYLLLIPADTDLRMFNV
jgi:hypothetical protein